VLSFPPPELWALSAFGEGVKFGAVVLVITCNSISFVIYLTQGSTRYEV
jgi:hypothetical protein